MLVSEYAFAEKAKNSVRGAFLEYLADDAVASGGDLGFTEGPYSFTVTESGKQFHGHFLTVWKRDASCAWRVEFDGGVSHPTPSISKSKLAPNEAPFNKTEPPPPAMVVADAASDGIGDFQRTAQQDGFAAALRTYGRDNGFLFLTDEQSPVVSSIRCRHPRRCHPRQNKSTRRCRLSRTPFDSVAKDKHLHWNRRLACNT